MKFIITILISVLFLFYTGCKDNTQSPPPVIDENNNGFETYEVAKVFAENCALSGCHGNDNPQHGLNLTSHVELMKGSSGRDTENGGHNHGKVSHTTIYGGEAVIPYNAEESLLFNLIAGNTENESLRMPYGKAPLSDSQIETIRQWINNGAKDNNGNVPFIGAVNNVYVCSQASDQVFVINTEQNLVSRVIDVNFNPTGADAPHNIQVKDNYLYLSLISANKLLKIDISSNSIAGEVNGLERAGMIEISQDGKRAYVSVSSTSSPNYNTIHVIDVENMVSLGEITLPFRGIPHAIALTKDGTRLYIADMNNDRISVCNTSTFEYIEDIDLSPGQGLVHEPMHMYLSPDDKYLYVNCRTSSKMLIISTETKQVLQEIPIDHHPMQSAVSPDGSKIYTVSHHNPVITEITKSGESWNITNRFESDLFHELYGAALTADGKYLYVTCSNETGEFEPHYKIKGESRASLVCVYDVQTKELIKVFDAANYATGIAAHP